MYIPFVFSMSTFNEAPYLWWFYKGMDMCVKNNWPIIAQEIYLNTSPAEFAKAGRKEAYDKVTVDFRFQYRLPKNSGWKKLDGYPIPETLLEQLIQEKGSIGDAFCYLLTNSYPPLVKLLEEYIEDIQKKYGTGIKGFLTLMHNPSLQEAANRHNIPVLHLEQGTFREPVYIKTAFLDKDSLYGGNTLEKRWNKFREEFNARKFPTLTKREMLSVLLQKDQLSLLDKMDMKPVKKCGIVLGYATYEMFSCYTHLTDAEVIYKATKRFERKNIIIRKHPGDPYGASYPAYGDMMEKKKTTAPEFILSCENIVTMLSGMGIEAMLLDRNAYTLLKCPSWFASAHSLDEAPKCADELFLNFFVFCYLIPYEFLLDTDYLDWRLSEPSERDIFDRNIDFYFRKKGIPSELLSQPGSDRLRLMVEAQKQ